MAVGLLSILTNIPWSEVINNAPKVADGAKKLWNVVAKKTHLKEISNMKSPVVSESQAISILEASISDLQSQMLASSELIKELADQNAQLIIRIEANRVRLLWLSMATAIVTVILGFGLIFS
jgi:hypothetical protein